MLPIPFEKFIPRMFRRDANLTALSDKADTHLEEWKADILDFKQFPDPLSIRSGLVDDLGELVAAELLDTDSDTIKRGKIAKAVEGHKVRGTFAFDIKLKIDTIVGGDSSIVTGIGLDDWVMSGDGINPPAGSFWAGMGGDGVLTDDYGIRLVGNGSESVVPGIVEIDVDDNALSAAVVLQIVESIENSVAAYMRVFLGAFTAGVFVRYANGQIH